MFSRSFIVIGWIVYACLGWLPEVTHGQAQPKDPPKTTLPLRLPSGAIIVVATDPDALDIPQSVRLTPAKYKELLDQIETLKRQSANDRLLVPSSCELNGKLEQRGTQWVAQVAAEYHFQTVQPNTVVFLGGLKAQAVDAKANDGKTPLLNVTEKGLSALIETAGEQSLRVEFEMPILPRPGKPGEVGFDLSLPGSAITRLVFENRAAKRFNIACRSALNPEAAPKSEWIDPERLAPAQGGEALGPIGSLAVTWEEPSRQPAKEATRTAQTEIVVQVTATELLFEAKLRLRGTAKEWRIQAPVNAEVSVGRAPILGSPKTSEHPLEQPPQGIYRPTDPNKPVWRIEFPEPQSVELLVTIRSRITRSKTNDPKAISTVPVGPFAVLDTTQQTGTVLVKTPTSIHVTHLLDRDTVRLDGPSDPNSDALFQYRSLPMNADKSFGAPMQLEIRRATGGLQTRLRDSLQLTETAWRLRTEIQASPMRTEVGYLDLEVPSSVQVNAAKEERVESISTLRELGPTKRVIRLHLAAIERKPFNVTVEIDYPIPALAQEMSLALPRLVGSIEGESSVVVMLPSGTDVNASVREWQGDRIGTWKHLLEASKERPDTATVVLASTPAILDLAWKPHRPDLRIETVSDFTLSLQQGRATQVMRVTSADKAPKKIRFRSSVPLTGIAVTPGVLEAVGPSEWMLQLPVDSPRETSFVWTYSFHFEEGAVFSLPLLWSDGVNAWESKVRLWREPTGSASRLTLFSDSTWQALPPEIVPDRRALPQLVARAAGSQVPLRIELHEVEPSSHPSSTNLWIDRLLIQVQDHDGLHSYRSRFALRRWTVSTMDVELPRDATEVESYFDGRALDLRDMTTEREPTRVVRIALPVWKEGTHSLVEFRYKAQLLPRAATSLWATTWEPPTVRGNPQYGSVRWQVGLPAKSIGISLDSTTIEDRWSIQSGLPSLPAARTTRELDDWITQGIEPTQLNDREWDGSERGVSARQRTLGPLRMILLPQTVWISIVSALVLAIGIFLTSCSRRTCRFVLALLVLLAIAVGNTMPQLFRQILAGGSPGFALLIAIVGIQRLLHWRYRRMVARLPGFSSPVGSSLLRSANKRPISRETSTIDGPMQEPWGSAS